MGLTLSLQPGYSDLQDTALTADVSPALGIQIAKMYTNAAFGKVRIEVFQDHYQNGDTVPLPVSPIDGYAYQRNELIYVWAIESTANFSSHWMSAKDSLWYCGWLVDQSTGAVACDEWYRRSGSHYNPAHTNDGVLRVFTVAQRLKADLVMATSPSYSAITAGWIAQDKPLTQQLARGLNDDAKFSVVNREVFYLGEYYDGQTVTLPTSAIDGYTYTAAECKFQFSWRWTTLGNASQMTEPLVSLGQMGPMQASVNSSGVVSTNVEYITDGLFGGTSITNMSTHGRLAVFAFCTRSSTPTGVTLSGFSEISYDKFMPGQTLPFDTVVQTLANDINEALGTPEYFGPTSYADGDTIPLPTSVFDPTYTYSRSELHYIYEWSDTTNQTGSNLRVPIWFSDVDTATGAVHLHPWRLPPGGPEVDDNDTLARISVTVMAFREAQTPNAVSGVSSNPSQSTSASVGTQDVTSVSTVNQDSFTGNGSSTAFTLTSTPQQTVAMVFVDGVLQRPTTDYSISGTTLTFTFTPYNGAQIYAIYFT